MTGGVKVAPSTKVDGVFRRGVRFTENWPTGGLGEVPERRPRRPAGDPRRGRYHYLLMFAL